ncbi:uncharacterized protein LOC132066167 [Lycium ferocissimum]|uniref:uncharacterized protein LOC132066167 n=1 Tax=Lycium ferocissimum TaxID=112874 RepID=UPI002814A523|nr:uncharacterized protein LOC132066167 [Lycium ferocissimum]
MAEGRGSSLVHLLVIILSLIAFGFSIAAERRRSTVIHSPGSLWRVATGYGVGALLMGVTKCMCFGRPLSPGSNRAWAIIYFISSWLTFLVAEACVVAGAKKNAYHTKYRDMLLAENFSCETLRKGVFIAGAVFIVATMILNVYFYMYFTKATTQPAHKTKRTSSNVGMAGYA